MDHQSNFTSDYVGSISRSHADISPFSVSSAKDDAYIRFVGEACETLLTLHDVGHTLEFLVNHLGRYFCFPRAIAVAALADEQSPDIALTAQWQSGVCEIANLDKQVHAEVLASLLSGEYSAKDKRVHALYGANQASPGVSTRSDLFPLYAKNRSFGVLIVEQVENHQTLYWPLAVSKLVQLVALKLHSLYELELYRSSRIKLQDTERLQHALFQIADITHYTENLNLFYEKLHGVVRSLIPAEEFCVGLYDKDIDNMELVYKSEAQHPVFDGFCERLSRKILAKNAFSMFSRAEIKDMFAHEFVKQPNLTELIPHVWLGVPFEINATKKGIIIVKSYDHSYNYGPENKELLCFLARHVATAIKRRMFEKQIVRQALSDSLTGLANRTLFFDRLEHAFSRLKRNEPVRFALLFLDLDKFKLVNDTHGHSAGDELLKLVSRRIAACLRANDTLSRLGGDEFAVLLENVQSNKLVISIVKRIIDAVKVPVNIEGNVIKTSTSIGIAMADVSLRPNTLLQQADQAMYLAKSQGRSNFCVYDKEIHQKHIDKVSLECEIKTAIENDEFLLYVQPCLDLSNFKIVSYEVLTYWQHPRLGLLHAGDYFPLLKDPHTLKRLDWLILEKLFNLLQSLQKIPKYQVSDAVSLSVNISKQLISDHYFAKKLQTLVDKYQVNARRLKIEVKESSVTHNPVEIKSILGDLHGVGVKLLLDDFGIGSSSLSQLSYFSIDGLKVDQSVVSRIGTNASDKRLVKAIVAVANSLGVEVIAEGIETHEQLVELRSLGVKNGQGYFLTKPYPITKLFETLKNQTGNNSFSRVMPGEIHK